MGRKEERIKKQLEKNPIKECNKIQNKYYPELFKAFVTIQYPISVLWFFLVKTEKIKFLFWHYCTTKVDNFL